MARDVHRPSLAGSPRRPRLSGSTSRTSTQKQPSRSRENKENSLDPPFEQVPRSFTAIEAMGQRKSSRLRADVTTNFAMPEDETLLGDVAPPSDLAGPSASSLFGSDDHDPAPHFVGPRGLGRPGRGVSGRGGLLTPDSSQQVGRGLGIALMAVDPVAITAARWAARHTAADAERVAGQIRVAREEPPAPVFTATLVPRERGWR